MSDRLILILTGGWGGVHTNLCRNFSYLSQMLTWRLYNEPDQKQIQIGGDGYTDR